MKPNSYIFTNDPNISHQNLYSQSIPNNGRCIKISVAGVDQKPNYNGLKFSEPFTKLQLSSALKLVVFTSFTPKKRVQTSASKKILRIKKGT